MTQLTIDSLVVTAPTINILQECSTLTAIQMLKVSMDAAALDALTHALKAGPLQPRQLHLGCVFVPETQTRQLLDAVREWLVGPCRSLVDLCMEVRRAPFNAGTWALDLGAIASAVAEQARRGNPCRRVQLPLSGTGNARKNLRDFVAGQGVDGVLVLG